MGYTTKILASILAIGLSHVGTVSAALMYDQNVTSNAIFGSGNDNGSFTVDRQDGVELGLRGKLRFDAAGQPQNTFNSDGNGGYNFGAGAAFGQPPGVAVWSLEWSINTNFDGNNPVNFLNSFTYKLGIDSDPSLSTDFALIFDPINGANPSGFWDHSIGNNSTAQGAGTEATDATAYNNLIANNNLAQNSWQAHTLFPFVSFDPTANGTYDFYLAAYNDGPGGLLEIARTDIQIIVGAASSPIPEPSTLLLFGLGILGLGYAKKKRPG